MKTLTQKQPEVLVNPIIELRNIKHFRGSDGYGLNASLYLNGKKIAFVLDEGRGGEMQFHEEGKTKEEIFENRRHLESLHNYAKTLPKEKITGITGLSEEDMWMQPDLASIIDNIANAEEEKKAKKKATKEMEKKMLTSILVGVPNSLSYSYFSYKVELTKIPLTNLQRAIDEKVIPSLKEGEVILNTNLKQLGVKY